MRKEEKHESVYNQERNKSIHYCRIKKNLFRETTKKVNLFKRDKDLINKK